ncbi:hypothetical protein DY000_02040548 [Brassica cretica]|uniref:Histone H2A n=1 Tax=Brassica cretica TaxID=69181 RepID=A0ABQ7BQK6_BRACR|nr:hypothetical protein DY000_02040548 [Brassica cretica]
MHGPMSYRRLGRARSLRSDRARYVATELLLELGRYVATELLLELGRYVATELFPNIDTTLVHAFSCSSSVAA